jgi:tetratricopeptide (TPR) repeat protein
MTSSFSSSDRTISVNPLALESSSSSASSSSSSSSSSSDSSSAAHPLEACGTPQLELPHLFPYHQSAELEVDNHNNNSTIDSSCGSSQESGWDVQPHFDFPQLFPYHTGFISVNGGRAATSTIPSDTSSVATTHTNNMVRSLEGILQDLHQTEWRRPRPNRRLTAAAPPLVLHESATLELHTLQQEIRTTRHSPRVLATLHHRVVQLALNHPPPNNAMEIAKVSLRAWKRILEKNRQAKNPPSGRSNGYSFSGQDWLELGHLQNDLGWYDQALESYEEALKRHPQGGGDEFEKAICYLSVGKTLLNQQKPEEAFQWLNKGHTLWKAIDGAQIPPRHNEWSGPILYWLARADLELGPPWDEALQRLQGSCRVLKAGKDWTNLLEICLATGRVYAQCQDYDKADQWYDDALQIVREQIPHDEQKGFQSFVARLYLAKGDVRGEATVGSLPSGACFEQALSLCQANPDIDPETTNEALVAFADMYCSQGDWNEALPYYEQGKEVAIAMPTIDEALFGGSSSPNQTTFFSSQCHRNIRTASAYLVEARTFAVSNGRLYSRVPRSPGLLFEIARRGR